jgi:N-acetylglucosamine kinase-like BadF-type ATPase
MSSPVLLGIDGGGTSTVAWLADASGTILGRGRAGPSNIKAIGADPARAALDQAIAAAFADAGITQQPVASACFGIAGFDRPEDRELLRSWSEELGWTRSLTLVNDGDLLLAAGTTEGWGLGVIAGTGSIAVGRAADGTRARAGGWGHLIGDEGSGYAVALAALRLIARRADGREPCPPHGDALAEEMLRALGIASPSQLVATIYSPAYDRTRIAALASAVVTAAARDPAVDLTLLDPAGRELGQAALAVANSLGWHTGPVPLALGGGFLLSASTVRRSLVAHLEQAGLAPRVSAVSEPVRGAVTLARRALAGATGDAGNGLRSAPG